MNTPDNSFLGAYLKVDRSYAHIGQLKAMVEPLHPDLYEIRWIKAIGLPCLTSHAPVDTDPDSKVMELAFFPKCPIPQILACIIGDAVHNLRAALDFAATAVVRASGGDTRFVTFPFHDERKRLVAAQATGLKQIQAALPDTDVERFFQDTIKSYDGGNSDLWMLTKADKIDKHNFLVPSVTASTVGMPIMNGRSGDGHFFTANSSMTGDASGPFGLVRTDVTNGFPEHADLQVSAQVSFPPGQPFGGREALPTLINLAKNVTQTLESFEQFCVTAGLYERRVPHSLPT